ncbi:Ercc1-like DNA excision repair [Tubulinosema ratisbonensis]|uniref:Ercc1-like DNA excision repair n=1 Tax=Tubulinosema ratisbonensis TaxID=291195 RepID=A0A437AQK1_9MICR|nr:Ercc1-like DNA excision repair [Tubulinosema ratisbonensis]
MIKVNANQKGNALLNYLSKSQWYFDSSINFDYEFTSIGLLFLSLKFHMCKPDYILRRMAKSVTKSHKILLLLADVKNYELILEQLFINSYKYNFTILISVNNEECSEYLKLIDLNQYKNTEILKNKKENLIDNFIGLFPKINMNDIVNIKRAFLNLRSVINSSEKELCNVNGINKSKAANLVKYFDMKFK